ncbi:MULTISPECIES: ATP-binding cassette domain-containing protein [unclassified Mesorhizobium]|uniref:ATP-binding cassette domain-containing protein n=1 Tax=unclassified Mesorhizobium TaxID=325217 RepID=UPI00301548C8
MRDEELHPQGKFFSSTIAQLFLTTVIAGVTAAIAEDAREVLGSRERTFYFAPAENAKDDPLLLASIGERHADAFATEAIVLAAARVLDEAATGGQRQRVMIAMAIALKPQLLIADEPTTALDASVREQILSLIDRLRGELNMAVLLISHDLPLVSRWTDRESSCITARPWRHCRHPNCSRPGAIPIRAG